ncbi:hypothetical protein [Actinophytocola sp.]|uniref:hypothetical protein n=1 Tax=Actinophytocola sp. TaxID=1872138 RepID=UPI002D7F57B7|nr:hypothetical protein [Actinophytocola sp.]HET9138384.1 hypothetical protein [Actinophytocola sp.]
MMIVRGLLGLAGLAGIAWGAVLVWDIAAASARDGLQLAAWLVGGPVLHDGLLAPMIGAVGLLVARRVPARWRGPVATGGVLIGILAMVAVPLLCRPFGVPDNPGLHDRDYLLGLLVARDRLAGRRDRRGHGTVARDRAAGAGTRLRPVRPVAGNAGAAGSARAGRSRWRSAPARG